MSYQIGPNFASFSEKWLLKENWFGIQIEKSIIFKRNDTCKHFWKDQSPPFVIFTLRCAFQAIENLFYWAWVNFKSSEFSLPCSIRQESQNIAYDNTLIELHHEVKNDTATPRYGGEGKEYHYTYFGNFCFLKSVK